MSASPSARALALAVLCAACPEGNLPPEDPPDAGTTTPDAGTPVTLVPLAEGPREVARGASIEVALSEEAGRRVTWALRATGDCVVTSAPTHESRGRSFARVDVGAPGSCTVTATASLGASHADASHALTVVEGRPLVRETVPDDFLGCPLDSDTVVNLDGRTWCSTGRSGVAIYSDTPSDVSTDFFPVALLDAKHVFACPIFRGNGAKCSVRDADGRLVVEVPFESVRGESWGADGKTPATIVRAVKTQTAVRIDTLTWDGTTLSTPDTRDIGAAASGRPWLSYLVVTPEPAHEDATGRPVVILDADTGAKVHEIPDVPFDSVVDVLSMRYLVVGRTVYPSLEAMLAGNGTMVDGSVSSPLDGILSVVTARRELEGTDLLRFAYYDLTGDKPERVAFGHEWFLEPYRNYLVAGDGVLSSHRLAWISWLRPAAP